MPMYKLLFLLPVFLLDFSAFGQGNEFQLPETWTKDFVITLSYHSSMGGGQTAIRFTVDSCTYRDEPRTTKPALHTYKMTKADRVAILKKLKELNAGGIRSESGMRAVYDGWSQSMCFGSHCIDGGTSAEMSDADKNTFLDAYRFLEEFAIKKTK